MVFSSEYLRNFMSKLEFPDDAQKVFFDVNLFFEQNPVYGEIMIEKINEYNLTPTKEVLEPILDDLNKFAEEIDVSSYTIHLLFFIYCSRKLQERYIENSISLDIFWDSMLDMRCKLYECYDVKGIWGTFVGGWYMEFFSLERFGLGRLQYERIPFRFEKYSKKGFDVYRDDIVYNIHIPSAGPLTKDKRMDSYKKAYEFFKNELDGRPLVIVCWTWLLYPDNEKFFPKGSNIIDFMHDFEIIDVKTHERLTPLWRIFGKYYKKSLDELPNDTSLQRAYIEWFKSGNQTGDAYGILLFDGERIL